MRDLTGVPALTLLNPWAHLIAHGTKRVENRSWVPPDSVSRLLIHAGKGWDTGPFADEWRDSLALIATSAVVAVADLAFVCDSSRRAERVLCGCGPWANPGQYHWSLINVRPLSFPVPCRGAQRLWRPPADVVAQAAAQLTAVTR